MRRGFRMVAAAWLACSTSAFAGDGMPDTLDQVMAQTKGMKRITPNQEIASSWVLIPAAVNTAGANGAYFRTKASIMLMSTTSATVTATFFGGGVVRTSSFQIGAAETKTFNDLLQDLFGISGAGAVTLSSPSSTDMIVSSEVYTESPAGRFSTATTAYTSIEYLGSTYYDFTVGVTVNSSTRANIACMNTSSYSAESVGAGLYDAPSPGPLLKVFNISLPPRSWQQITIDVPVNGGTIWWKPVGYNVYCYAVNVNNTSNDGTFLGKTTYVP